MDHSKVVEGEGEAANGEEINYEVVDWNDPVASSRISREIDTNSGPSFVPTDEGRWSMTGNDDTPSAALSSSGFPSGMSASSISASLTGDPSAGMMERTAGSLSGDLANDKSNDFADPLAISFSPVSSPGGREGGILRPSSLVGSSQRAGEAGGGKYEVEAPVEPASGVSVLSSAEPRKSPAHASKALVSDDFVSGKSEAKSKDVTPKGPEKSVTFMFSIESNDIATPSSADDLNDLNYFLSEPDGENMEVESWTSPGPAHPTSVAGDSAKGQVKPTSAMKSYMTFAGGTGVTIVGKMNADRESTSSETSPTSTQMKSPQSQSSLNISQQHSDSSVPLTDAGAPVVESDVAGVESPSLASKGTEEKPAEGMSENEKLRAPLVDTYAPYIQGSDTSLEDARERLRTALEQTRKLRAAFTDRVYKKYRVILRPVPKTVDAMLDRIMSDPASASLKLQEETAMIKDEKEMEKKEAQEMTASAKSSGGEKPSPSSAGDTAEQLMYFSAGLSLVILPEDEVDEDEIDIRAYEHRGPTDPDTGHRLGGISSAAAAAAETLLERVRLGSAMRMERHRKRQLQILTGDEAGEGGEADLSQWLSSGDMGMKSQRVATGVASSGKSMKSLQLGSHKRTSSQPASSDASVKLPRIRPQAALSGNGLLTLAPSAESLAVYPTPSAATAALISCGVGSGVSGSGYKAASQQARWRHPHPESIAGRKLALAAANSGGQSSKKGSSAGAATAAALAARVFADTPWLALPPKPTQKQRREVRLSRVLPANKVASSRALKAVRNVMEQFAVHENVVEPALNESQPSAERDTSCSVEVGIETSKTTEEKDAPRITDEQKGEKDNANKQDSSEMERVVELKNNASSLGESKRTRKGRKRRVTEIGFLRSLRASDSQVILNGSNESSLKVDGPPSLLPGSTTSVPSTGAQDNSDASTVATTRGGACDNVKFIDPILAYSVLHALGVIRDVPSLSDGERQDEGKLRDENLGGDKDAVDQLYIGPSLKILDGGLRPKLGKQSFSEAFMDKVSEKNEAVTVLGRPNKRQRVDNIFSETGDTAVGGVSQGEILKGQEGDVELVGGRTKEVDDFETSLITNIRGGGETISDCSEDELSSDDVRLRDQRRGDQTRSEKLSRSAEACDKQEDSGGGCSIVRNEPVQKLRQEVVMTRPSSSSPLGSKLPAKKQSEKNKDSVMIKESFKGSGRAGFRHSDQSALNTQESLTDVIVVSGAPRGRGSSSISAQSSSFSQQSGDSLQAAAIWGEPRHSHSATAMLSRHMNASGLESSYSFMPQAALASAGGASAYQSSTRPSSDAVSAAMARLQGQQRNSASLVPQALAGAHERYQHTPQTIDLTHTSLQHATFNHHSSHSHHTAADLADYFGGNIHHSAPTPGGYSHDWAALGVAGLLPAHSSLAALGLSSHHAAMVDLSMRERAARVLLAREQQAAVAAAQAHAHAHAAVAHRHATAAAAGGGRSTSSLSSQQAAMFSTKAAGSPGGAGGYAQSPAPGSRFAHLSAHGGVSASAVLSSPGASTFMTRQQQQPLTSATLASKNHHGTQSHQSLIKQHVPLDVRQVSTARRNSSSSHSSAGGSRPSSAASRLNSPGPSVGGEKSIVNKASVAKSVVEESPRLPSPPPFVKPNPAKSHQTDPVASTGSCSSSVATPSEYTRKIGNCPLNPTVTSGNPSSAGATNDVTKQKVPEHVVAAGTSGVAIQESTESAEKNSPPSDNNLKDAPACGEPERNMPASSPTGVSRQPAPSVAAVSVSSTESSTVGMRFIVPPPPLSLNPSLADLILQSRFHKATHDMAQVSSNLENTAKLMVEYLLAVGAAVPIPKALVTSPLKEKLSSSYFKILGGAAGSTVLPREIIAAVIMTWLWTQHKDCFVEAFAKSGRIDVDPQCTWLVQAAVDVSARALLSEILESGLLGLPNSSLGGASQTKPSSGAVKVPELTSDGASEASPSAISEFRVASLVSETLMMELCIDDEMDVVLPNLESLVNYLDELRMTALSAKSQERALLAALISRRATMSEAFSHAYVSALVRAGEALGHNELCEAVQDDTCGVSTMIPHDILSDSTGAWEDPCRPQSGFTSGLTGDELTKRAHARAMIQRSLKKLQDRQGIKGGVSDAGPYKDTIPSKCLSGPGISGGNSVGAGEKLPPALSRSSSGSLKRKSSLPGTADATGVPGIGGPSAARVALFSPNHYSSPFVWDGEDNENKPYGRHGKRGRSRSLSTGRYNFGVAADLFGDGPRASKRSRHSNSPLSGASPAATSSSPLKKKDGSKIVKSTVEIKWSDVAGMFQPVSLGSASDRGGSASAVVGDTPTARAVNSNTIVAPFCRKLDPADFGSSNSASETDSEEEEDISDEAILARHQFVLDHMKMKLDQAMEIRQHQQQRSRSRSTGGR